jgi:tetratricopeptide (TPR) repeat protein
MRAILAIFLLFSFIIPAAAMREDSLGQWLEEHPHDSLLLKRIYKRSKALWSVEPERSIAYSRAGLRIADSLRLDFHRAKFYNGLGVAYSNMSEFGPAIENLKKAITIYTRIGDGEGAGMAYNNLGVSYKNQGQFDLALENYLEALRLFEKLGRHISIGDTYMNMAIVCKHKGVTTKDEKELDRAIENCNKALEQFTIAGDSMGMARVYNTMGTVCESRLDLDCAYSNYMKTYAIFKAGNNPRNMAIIINNLAAVHARMKEYDKAVSLYQESLQLSKKTRNFLSEAGTRNNMSLLYGEMKLYKLSEAQLDTAIMIGKRTGQRTMLADSYGALISVYKAQGKFAQAVPMYELLMQLKDSMVNEANLKSMTEMEKKYESEKKDLEIKSLESEKTAKDAEISRQNFQKVAFASGLGLTLLLVFFVFRSYRQKQKANLLITEQKYMLEEKQKEILDSIYYASRIQQSLMPSDRYIARILERLKKD